MKKAKKYVVRTIQNVVSVVSIGAILGGTSGCSKEVKPSVNNDDKNTIGLEQIYDKITTQDALEDILKSESLDEVKRKLKDLVETPLTISEQNDVVKYDFKKLVKRYFAKEDETKLDLTGIYYSDNGANLFLEIGDVSNTENLVKFLDKLQEEYSISQITISADTLESLDYTFNNLNLAIITNSSKVKKEVDLAGKFNDLNSLILSRVNAKNIPESITKLSFEGKLDDSYKVDAELRQIPNLDKLAFLEFYTMKVERIYLPIWDYPFIRFENCFGETELDFTNSKSVYIENKTTEEALAATDIPLGNYIYITGNISERLEIIDPNSKVVIGYIIGDPEILKHEEEPCYEIAFGSEIYIPEEPSTRARLQ